MGMIRKLVEAFRQGDVSSGAPEQGPQEVASPDVTPMPEGAAEKPLPVPEPRELAPATDRRPGNGEETEPGMVGVKRVVLSETGLSVLDLRELPSNRFRIVGSAYWVTDTGRYKHGGNEYSLVREPKNRWDANAVAVYGKGRKVGYLTKAKAAALAPIFDALPYGAFRVGGAPPSGNSITMWVDIPALPKLRKFTSAIAVSQAGKDDRTDAGAAYRTR